MLTTAVLLAGLFTLGPSGVDATDATAPIVSTVEAPVAPVTVDAAASVLNDTVSAAAPDEQQEAPPRTHTAAHEFVFGLLDDVKHLPSLPNLYIAAGGGALALAVHPADSRVNGSLQNHASFATAFWKPGHIVGSGYVELGAAVVTFAYGGIFHAPKATHFGLDMLRAEILAQGLTEILKHTVRRERPDHSDVYSFPSGHSAGAFALATIIERHMRWQMAGVAYALAAYVAASRLHDNVHYLSDVVFGAAVGTISGRTATNHGRNDWTFMPIPTDGGMALMITRRGP